MAKFTNLDASSAFRELQNLRPLPLASLLSARRIASSDIPMGGGLFFNWAASPMDEKILDTLGRLAIEQELVAKYRLLAEGAIMNTGEKRMVLHHLARGQLGAKVERGAGTCAPSTRESARRRPNSPPRCIPARSRDRPARPSRRRSRSASGARTSGRAPCTSPSSAGREPRQTARWKRDSYPMSIPTTATTSSSTRPRAKPLRPRLQERRDPRDAGERGSRAPTASKRLAWTRPSTWWR